MWLFTRQGFFSVVADRDPGILRVRARAAADLDALRRQCPQLGPTLVGAGTDYEFRARVPADAFATWAARAALEVDYDNFKGAVAAAVGYARERVYHAVWDVLRRELPRLGVQHQLRRPKRPADLDAEWAYVSECHCGQQYGGDTLAQVREQHRDHLRSVADRPR